MSQMLPDRPLFGKPPGGCAPSDVTTGGHLQARMDPDTEIHAGSIAARGLLAHPLVRFQEEGRTAGARRSVRRGGAAPVAPVVPGIPTAPGIAVAGSPAVNPNST